MSLRPLRAALGAWSPTRLPPNDPLAAIAAAWPAIVGPAIAAHTRPAEIARDTLVVVTRSSAWSQQLSLLSVNVLSALHDTLGQRDLTRLRFRVGTVGRTRSAMRRARAVPPTEHGEAPAPLPDDATAGDALERLRQRVTLRTAAAACPRCGASRPEASPCAPCAAAVSAERMTTTLRLMYDAPWLAYAGIAAIVDGLRREEYEAWRRWLLGRWWERLVRARYTGRVGAGERRIASSFVLLQSQIEPDRVTPAVVRNLLGDELAALIEPASATDQSTSASRGNARRASAK